MANQLRELGFKGTTTKTAESNTVFVDTSLDTHFAMLVVESDTVSDFKKKIALEHMHCFPKIEDLHIHSLQVKREGRFYHLPDSMLVWSAFFSAGRNWFLWVDASSSSTQKIIPSLEKTTDFPNSYLFGKQKNQDKKKRKRSHKELGQDVRADQSGAVPFKVPDISAGLVDALETTEKIQDTDTSTRKNKRKKKKSKKLAIIVVSEKREPAEENHLSSGDGHADSTRNGSTGANGQSTAGKGRSTLDILSGEEITMEKILRSSMRFKQNEANEAVQNESQPIEFVPDSLP